MHRGKTSRRIVCSPVNLSFWHRSAPILLIDRIISSRWTEYWPESWKSERFLFLLLFQPLLWLDFYSQSSLWLVYVLHLLADPAIPHTNWLFYLNTQLTPCNYKFSNITVEGQKVLNTMRDKIDDMMWMRVDRLSILTHLTSGARDTYSSIVRKFIFSSWVRLLFSYWKLHTNPYYICHLSVRLCSWMGIVFYLQRVTCDFKSM